MTETEATYEDMDAEDFLELVWGEHGGWVDLPTKVGRYWVPFYTEWPADTIVSRRIDSALRDREDLYYSVAKFSQRGRRIEDLVPPRWLWADLDEIHPTAAAKLGLMPTIAVESSPGRYQGLWRLSRPLNAKPLERLNRALSYALDADKGGWDLTQVLRIPGTRNFKYPEAPVVRLLWHREELVYDARKVWSAVKEYAPAALGEASVSVPRSSIPSKAKALLRATADTVVEGERSARLWELECLLAESGIDEAGIFALVAPSAWNKWAGTGQGGERRLKADIRKALGHVARKSALKESDGRKLAKNTTEGILDRGRLQSDRSERAESDGAAADRKLDASHNPPNEGELQQLPWVGYSTFMAMAMEEPKWLIENIWTASSHGFIAGEPKTNKTTIALALALSVASGEPFLGRYSVGVSGPVLMVQEENAPWMMQDRLRKIAAYMGLISKVEAHVRPAGPGALGSTSVDLDFPVDVPLRLLNNYGFDLGVEEHRDMLEAEVSDLRPKLVILDPMYLIVPADVNSADALRPFLQWVIQLRYRYDTAVAIVHHKNKEQAGRAPGVRPGQRILGSTILHGFSDSAIYTSARDESREGWVRCLLETEFRSMAPQKPVEVALSMGAPGSLLMEAEVSSRSLEQVIEGIVRAEPGITVNQLSERLGIDKRTVLSRVRGASETEFRLEGGKKGRGQSWQVYLGGEEVAAS